MTIMPDLELQELLAQFLIEGRELVQAASDDLLALERDPADAARIDGAFRAVHSLKGAVGLFDVRAMGAVLHEAEDVLGALRARSMRAEPGVIDALMRVVTASESWVEAIAATGSLPAEAAVEAEDLRAALRAQLAPPPVDVQEAGPAPWLAGLQALAMAQDAVAASRAVTALRYTPNADCFFLGDDPIALMRTLPGLLFLRIDPRSEWAVSPFDPFHCNLVVSALSAAPLAELRAACRFVADQVELAAIPAAGAVQPAAGGAERAAQEGATRILRVDAARMDGLADLVGELIVAKNTLAHLARRAAAIDAGLARDVAASQAEIDRLAGAMHRAVMGVCMMSLGRVFQRLPRLVRETASQLGREVAFSIEGGDVEADRAVVDALFEPLIHVLRNAVDHGIEPPDARRAAGKTAAGHIRLAAARAGEQIVMTISDDGAGIDPTRVRQAASERGVVEAAALAAMDDSAVLALIFAPGFSTARGVTQVSGRGVGMDVVRSAVETLGGRVSVTSQIGQGTVVRLSLPHTALVTAIMTVRLDGEHYGVPIESVAETTRIAAARILPIRDGEAFVLRDRTVPVLALRQLLGVPPRPRGSQALLLIAQAGGQHVAIEVDGLAGRMDVLLRPMTGLLAGMRGMLGHALLGDGRVLMVLNVPELVA
jgi:two-component system chemotaxis sensor kinase CheA